jgi:hypothetical protein
MKIRMSIPGKLLWYGPSPLPGILYKLNKRGFTVLENPDEADLNDSLLGITSIVVFSHEANDAKFNQVTYKQLPRFINHGILVLILANRKDKSRIHEEYLKLIDPEFPWTEEVTFLNDLRQQNFDNIVEYQPTQKWSHIRIVELDHSEKLKSDERLLICRAFQNAEELHIHELQSGFTTSRVFMAYEKRRLSSTAHWTLPRLVKIGDRKALAHEVGAMKDASPFIPFELRPNLEVYVEGFSKSVYVADFVEKSESMLVAARAGRAENAISNLFNRTLLRWRDIAWQKTKPNESLALAAERLGIISPDKIHRDYLDSEPIQNAGINVNTLWAILKNISFEHRSAIIHGDLHGDNIRVRGDDAILIDLGEVKGTNEFGKGAPICFDVAMLEVALVFTCTDEENASPQFKQPEWEQNIRPFYDLDAILCTPDRDSAPRPDFWLFGCLQRVRAFSIYEQSDSHEYAIALVIALWRWCKFSPKSVTDKGRRVVALEIGAHIIRQIEAQRKKSP